MPLNCPIGLVPFLAPDACWGCRYQRQGQCIYFGIKEAEPLENILTLEERVIRLERRVFKPEEPKETTTTPEPEDITGAPSKGNKGRQKAPKFTGGIKV